MERATAPTVWAMPNQIDVTARPSAPKLREIGPGPLRTARGAGRNALDRVRPLAEPLAGADLPRAGRVVGRLELVPRDRVLALVLDVLELREPGGEDVRVAMLRP